MSRLRFRLARIPKFGRMVIGVVIGSVALVTALAYWQNRLGYLGIGVIGGITLASLVAVIALPQRAWARIAGVGASSGTQGKFARKSAFCMQTPKVSRKRVHPCRKQPVLPIGVDGRFFPRIPRHTLRGGTAPGEVAPTEVRNTVVQRMDENQDLFKRILDEPSFRQMVLDHYAERLYGRLRAENDQLGVAPAT
jgi:hypothetical protein